MALHNRVVFLVLVFLALQMVLIFKAHAEYRVYRLGVTYDQDTPEVEVITTLDNLQYPTYYQLTATQKTRLIDHWMCWGRTDNMVPYCEKPYTPPPPQSKAASNVRQPAQSLATP